MRHSRFQPVRTTFLAWAAVTVFGLTSAAARAEQFVLFDVTLTFTKQDADNSTPSKSHYYVRENMLNPKRPKDWTNPVDYRNGTVHIRTEVIEKPEGDERTTWSLCYIPNKGQKNGYGCTGTVVYREKGVYEQDVKMTSFWQNDSIIWSEGIKQMDLVIKDGSGGGGHAHKRKDSEKFFPTKVRITMVQVSAGSSYDPSLVPNLTASPAKEKEKNTAASSMENDPKDVAATRETTPPSMSLYLPISIGVQNVDNQSTGVFIPENFRAGSEVDLVLYLRGYDIKRPKTATSVREYWGSPQHPTLKSFLLREEVNKSGKNVILVVPPLGPFSNFGKLNDEGGVQAFLEQVLDGLSRNAAGAGQAKKSTIRHLILAAHSGGGVPLRRLALILGKDPRYKDKLKECWGFDSTYGVRDKDAEFWSEWAKEHPGAKATMFYIPTYRDVGKDPKIPVSATNPLDHRQPTGTTFPALELERLARSLMLGNVTVVRETAVGHNDVPIAHLAELLKAAPYLENR